MSSVMQGAQGEMIDRLAQLIEGVQQMRQEGETRHAAVMDALQALPLHDTLDRHSRQFKALFDLLRGAALGKIWLRAYSTEFCHPIRRKVATQPTSKLPCSPSESCHPIRRKVAPDSGVKLPPPSERSDAACFYG